MLYFSSSIRLSRALSSYFAHLFGWNLLMLFNESNSSEVLRNTVAGTWKWIYSFFFIIGIIENEILVKLENGIKTGIQCYRNFAASVAISFTCLSNSSAPNYFNQFPSWSRNIYSKLNSKFLNRTEHDSLKKIRWKKPTELVKNYFKN